MLMGKQSLVKSEHLYYLGANAYYQSFNTSTGREPDKIVDAEHTKVIFC